MTVAYWLCWLTDKMMHVLDYQRALGELLELDDTIRASIEHLKKIGEYEDTLIVVTADHGHGFDVLYATPSACRVICTLKLHPLSGGVDTQYLTRASSNTQKRAAVGTYANSGLSGYTAEGSPQNNTVVVGAQGPNFPTTWDPRFALAAGVVAHPDIHENYTTRANKPRVPAVEDPATEAYVPGDAPDGILLTGNLPVNDDQGVHSLTDVAVYANGPGSEAFRGVFKYVVACIVLSREVKADTTYVTQLHRHLL